MAGGGARTIKRYCLYKCFDVGVLALTFTGVSNEKVSSVVSIVSTVGILGYVLYEMICLFTRVIGLWQNIRSLHGVEPLTY